LLKDGDLTVPSAVASVRKPRRSNAVRRTCMMRRARNPSVRRDLDVQTGLLVAAGSLFRAADQYWRVARIKGWVVSMSSSRTMRFSG